MKVHPGALKHGVSAEDAVQAAEWPLWIEPLEDDGPLLGSYAIVLRTFIASVRTSRHAA